MYMIAVPFVLTVIVGKRKLAVSTEQTEAASPIIIEEEEEPAETAAEEKETVLRSFLSGEVIPLSEVNDGVFSEGIMGDGLAVRPDDNVVYAPADGKVIAVMEESRHACGLALAKGMEILIHVGIDTVNMHGDGFEYFVKEGETVKAGAPLIRFDREKIKKAGYTDVTVFVVTEEGNASDIKMHTGMKAAAKETEILSYK